MNEKKDKKIFGTKHIGFTLLNKYVFISSGTLSQCYSDDKRL